MSSPALLGVELYGRRIGVLEQRNGGSRWLPDPGWAAEPAGQRPVLGQRSEERPWTEVRAGQGLPDWFEHLLPEEGGPLRRAVARASGVRDASSFAIAAAVGEDLPGAVVLRLDPGGARIAAGRRVVDEETGAAAPLATLRFSLAGLQLKFSARVTEKGLAVGYGGNRIVKLADQRYDQVPRNEHAVMTWASRSGIDVPATSLMPAREIIDLPAGLELRDPEAFVIDRFDRPPGGGRVHQEDFAQILGLSPREGSRDKYEGTNLDSLARVIGAVLPEDAEEFIRRVTFMVLSANTDMHAKNWSVVYPDRLRPRLSPAYDLLCTDVYVRTGRMAFKLAGVLRFDDVGIARLEKLGEYSGLDAPRTRDVAKETIERARAAWPEARQLAPPLVGDFLDDWIPRCLLVKQLGGAAG